MSAFNVLITGAGTTTAVTVLKGLRMLEDPSIRVFMGDIQPDCAGAFLGDAFVLMPPAGDPDFPGLAVDICRRHDIHLVIPIIDYEFGGWSRVADALGLLGTRVVISPPHVISQCEEKDLTIRYFNKIGIPCPPTRRAGDIADPGALAYPVFLKPRCGRASLDTHRADGPSAFRHHVSRTKDLLVQPLLNGNEVTIDTLSDFNGQCLAASPRVRVEVKSGQAYRSVTIQAPELAAMAQKIVEGLPIIGPSNIQCFLTEAGPVFFEINARFGAGTALSIAAGVNGPGALAAMARGKALPPVTPRPNVWMMRYWQEVVVERSVWPIFLDLDGPILDVSQRHYQVYRDILLRGGHRPLPFEAYWQRKRARQPLAEIVTRTAGSNGYYGRVFLPDWFDRIESEPYLRTDRPWPGVTKTLAALHRQHDLYLVTARSDPGQLRKQLEYLGLAKWFRAVLCRPARINAGREKVLAIRDFFPEPPRKGLMVGDTEADVYCGKALGFVTVGVTCGIRDKECLETQPWDYLLADMDALPGLVRNLYGEMPCRKTTTCPL